MYKLRVMQHVYPEDPERAILFQDEYKDNPLLSSNGFIISGATFTGFVSADRKRCYSFRNDEIWYFEVISDTEEVA